MPEALAMHLKDNLTALYANKELRSAGTGNDALSVQNKLVRSDMIYWLDKKHNNQYENDFFELMDLFVSHLNTH